MPQFELANALPQIVWLGIIFAVLYLTLSRGALPRIDRVVEQRAKLIGDDLAAAERSRAEAETTIGAYESALAEARNQAAKVTAEAKVATSRETETRLKAVDVSIEARSAEANARLEAARAEALAGLDAVAAQATVDIVERLTGRRPSEADARAALAA